MRKKIILNWGLVFAIVVFLILTIIGFIIVANFNEPYREWMQAHPGSTTTIPKFGFINWLLMEMKIVVVSSFSIIGFALAQIAYDS